MPARVLYLLPALVLASKAESGEIVVKGAVERVYLARREARGELGE